MKYLNKVENRITVKIKTGNYLELLTPETIKLLISTESKITKDENEENLPHLETIQIILFHWNFFHSDYQQDSRILYTSVFNKLIG